MRVNKVLLVILVILVTILSVTNVVYADSVTVNMRAGNTKYQAGQTITISVSLSNIDSQRGIFGLNGTLSYDTAVFEPIVSDASGNTESIVSVNGWGNVTYNSTTNKFSVVTTSSAKTSQNIMQISLKVKDTAALGSTYIMLTDLTATNGNNDIATSPETLSLTIEKASDSGNIPVATATPVPTTKPTDSGYVKPTVPPTTPPSGNLPDTGLNDHPILLVLGGVIIITGISFIAYRKYKDI